MNKHAPPHAAELCLHRLLERTEDFVRREPMTAVAVAIGAGLILKVLPPRVVARPLTTLAVQLLPPTLIGFGLLKVLELCCQEEHKPELLPSAGVS
jgi:hypothetical protein